MKFSRSVTSVSVVLEVTGSTRAIQKSLTLNKKCLRILDKGSGNGPLAESLQDRKSKRTRQKNESGSRIRMRKKESNGSLEISDVGWRISHKRRCPSWVG